MPLHPLQLHGDKELASKLPFCKAASVKKYNEVVNINMRSNNIVITISSVSNNGDCELESRIWFKTHSNHLSLDKEIAVKAPGVIEPPILYSYSFSFNKKVEVKYIDSNAVFKFVNKIR